MIGYYKKIIQQVCSDNEVAIESIEVLSSEERKKILYDFNETSVNFPNNKKIHELFEQQVEKTPNLKAVSCEDRSLTYNELNKLSNSLAHTLIERGVGRDKIVALISHNSIETLIGILGVLKAGGAYLPIDPKTPRDRIEYVINDSKTELLLVGEDNLIGPIEGVKVLNLKNENIYENSILNIKPRGNMSDLAYVIYTSGTTGKPKGVMIEHKNVVNYCDSCIKHLFGEKRQVVPLYTSISFDLVTTVLLPPLLRGDEIISYRDNDINKVMSENRVTLLKLTPSHMEMIKNFDNSNSNVEMLIVGGEELKGKLAQEVYNSFGGNIKIFNEYGPTETTVGCNIYKYDYHRDQKNTISIGKPIQNTKLYILDKAKEVCPIGVSGELCIGGVGVGRGYINNDILTNEKFVENPFIQGDRIYRTGDLARWSDKGNVEFLGRIDNQIKIRGFRIEPAEIENMLLKVIGINKAVVLALEKDEEKILCAYYVGEVYDIEYIKECLSKELPEYMIPMYFIKLDKIPLNQNGKVDMKELQIPEYSSEDYILPRNPLEKSLEEIFREVLKLENISVTDDFFDLGGHSLKAMNLVARIKSATNATINLMDIFENSTVEKLAVLISSKYQEQYQFIEKAENSEYYPLSSAQKRIFILQNLEPDSIAYNIPSILILNGKVNKEKIEDIIKKIINRHEAFRTSFKIIDENFVQKIWEEVDFRIIHKRIEDETNVEIEINKFIKAFNLEKAPLLRVALIEQNSQKHILMIDMHHIISDGASSEIIIEEFIRLYSDEELSNKMLEYKDYAVWQNSQISQNKIENQGEYWKSVLYGDLPVLKLDSDFTRPSIQSFEGESFDFYIDEYLIADLRRLVRENDATLFMVLLAGFKVLLYKYSGQEDIIVGTPVSGRNRTELLNIVGMFVNVLAIRSNPRGDKTFKNFLGELKKITVDAFDNQDFQFEELIEVLNVRRDTSRNPIFDVMFSIENIESKNISIDSVEIEDYKRENTISKFDLTLNAVENTDNIYFSFEYCKKLFRKDTIERMANHYINILKSITNKPDIELDKLDILTDIEKELFIDTNTNLCEYPKDKTFYMLFEEQVERTPEKIAVVYKDKVLTYRELNAKANQLARHLRNIGVESESKVGILLDRGLDMIVAVIGVMKSGGAYIPLDESYPEERINFILNDCQAMALIVNGNLYHSLEFSGNIIDIYDDNISKNDQENLVPISFYNNLIYIIYTSGTSGNPKGVMLEHRNITNIAFAWKEDYKLEEMDVNVLQFASFSFDVFCGDLCRALLNGGKLSICSTEERSDIKALYNIIENQKITIFESTPSLIVELMKYIHKNNLPLNNLKLLILGSDVCKMEDFKRINNQFGKNIRILNSYGLTETAIDSSFFEMRNSKVLNSINVPIGRPMKNNKFYILDKNLNYLPLSVSGELYIGGEGVARGYVNNEALTSEKFIQNPFVKGEMLYKTGDLARWILDGNVEFIGRKDNQVKIRGFRIEISEIENILMTYNGIEEAAVIPVECNNDIYLYAYYSAQIDINTQKVKEFLLDIIPSYMIPSYFIQLEKIPLNSNGKIDRKALAKLDKRIERGREYEASRNDIEEKLVKIWREVLCLDKISINDNFFHIGGHSLKAISLVLKINEEFSDEVSIREIFKAPTIKELAKYIKGSGIEGKEYKNTNVVVLKKGSEEAENLFVIHDGTGDIGGYIEFCNSINGDFNCLGIRAEKLENYTPKNCSVEEIAEKYIKVIRRIQPQGKYNIVGWSTGGVIAFEMIRQLEQINKQVGIVVLFDSMLEMENIEKDRFTLETEKKFAEYFLIDKEIKEKVNKESRITSIWTSIVEHFEENKINIEAIKECIPNDVRHVTSFYEKSNISEVIYNFNIIRTLDYSRENYIPINKVDAQIFLFKATESIELDPNDWNRYCEKTIQFEEVEGDHFTIFKSPNVKELAERFDKLIYSTYNDNIL